MKAKNKFEVGQLVMTAQIAADRLESLKFTAEIANCLQKYFSCEWGALDVADWKQNDKAIISGETIFAAYKTSKGKIYIITEWDRSVTTVLYANEY